MSIRGETKLERQMRLRIQKETSKPIRSILEKQYKMRLDLVSKYKIDFDHADALVNKRYILLDEELLKVIAQVDPEYARDLRYEIEKAEWQAEAKMENMMLGEI